MGSATMKKNLFETVIDITKEKAKIGDSPMAYIKDKDGKLIVSLLAIDKELIAVTLHSFIDLHKAEEIVLVNDVYYLESDLQSFSQLKMPISKNPKRKECFVVQLFTKDKEIFKALPYHRKKVKGKEILVWDKEMPEIESDDDSDNKFNPFKVSKEDIENSIVKINQERIRSLGIKEEIKLPMGFKMIVYRHEGKAFFEFFNADDENFGAIKPIEDDDDFQQKLKMAVDGSRIIGEELEKRRREYEDK